MRRELNSANSDNYCTCALYQHFYWGRISTLSWRYAWIKPWYSHGICFVLVVCHWICIYVAQRKNFWNPVSYMVSVTGIHCVIHLEIWCHDHIYWLANSSFRISSTNPLLYKKALYVVATKFNLTHQLIQNSDLLIWRFTQQKLLENSTEFYG